MDIIRFPSSDVGMTLKLDNAVLVENLDSKMWIERYLDAGEFTFTADPQSNAAAKLPIKSLISHTDTTELMIVENHEIKTSDDGTTELKISGRSFETFLELRIVGVETNWSIAEYPYTEFKLPVNHPWVQAGMLIFQHMLPETMWDETNGIYNVVVAMMPELAYRPLTGLEEPRVIKRGEVYKEVLSLLKMNSMGLRSMRPNRHMPITKVEDMGLPSDALILEIHEGIDQSKTVSFSHDRGELENGNYLWSNKNDRNAAIVYGKWVEVIITGDETGYDRRWMEIDASDIDGKLSEAPTGTELETIKRLMNARGKQALASKNNVEISNVNVKKTIKAPTWSFRKDYQVGDLVGVNGEYDTSSIYRVIEYVEIEDKDGQVGYPTLAKP